MHKLNHAGECFVRFEITSNTLLKEQFEENGTVCISAEDGSVGIKGNDRGTSVKADVLFAF